MQLFKKHSPFLNLTLFYILTSFFLRVVLIVHPITQAKFGLLELFKIFSFGIISDFFVFVIASSFLWLYLLFLSNSKYYKPWGYIIFGTLVTLLIYITFFNTILNDYGGSASEIGISFVALKTILFGLLLFFPKYRAKIRLSLFSVTVFIFVLVIIQNAVSEYFFWNEFGVKYNFIAVDYLVYTNTVIGNIIESYPVIPLFVGVGTLAVFFTFIIVKKSQSFLENLPSFGDKIKNLVTYALLFIIALFMIPLLSVQENNPNVFNNELQSNGVYKFYLAFINNELDYDKFYKTIPEKEAFALLKNQIPTISNQTTLHKIQSNVEENHKNVVLITVESLSADFMSAYGNKKHITPFLDSLATKSLQFTNLFAVGNRTVRGLEAVTLCLPPMAAESVIKRKDNKNKFSTGNLFKQRGYDVKFMYGGDAFFDNMEDFFGGNGYDIVDKKSFLPNEITFSNIWGVCDEDMYSKAIKVMNEESASGKPFFNHIMTVSNHRPYTFPKDKITVEGNEKSRNGAVKYTDYALKQFFKMAEKQSWYKNTVFVILADHCSSSSGKTELPLDKYKIPAIIYSPGFIKPKHYTQLMSQIDVMPTLFGLLNFTYDSKFYGQDVLKKDYKPRALIATYQDLGLIKEDMLTIISPGKNVKQFKLILQPKGNLKDDFQIFYDEKFIQKPRKYLINETISYYQTAATLLKNDEYNR